MSQPVPREEERGKLHVRLQSLDRDAFRAAIRAVRDDDLLGDLRYDFDWDPDPRKSTWQAIEINRLLTRRKEWRNALPQWIGILVGNILALAALVVAILK